MALLEVRHAAYGVGSKKILDDLDMSIREGEIHALIGTNGKGRFSRSMIKSRVALEGEARADIVGMTEGSAEGARGHMDCMEIIKDQAIGQSTPIVKVSHPLAKITHEAAIGTVDKKQMETLIAHGLSPEQATDMIVLGILQ